MGDASNVGAAPKDARRDARRSVSSVAGPMITMATTLVMARPVSHPPVEVANVNRRTGGGSSPRRAGHEGQLGVGAAVNGQNHRFSSNPYANADTAPYAASSAISARPRAAGSSPAPSPTHDAASIWNGSHGPTPPVRIADANSVVDPSTKPNPGP